MTKDYVTIFVPRRELHRFGEYVKETKLKHGPYNTAWGGYNVPVRPGPELTFWQLKSGK